jgi:hypothetical protein
MTRRFAENINYIRDIASEIWSWCWRDSVTTDPCSAHIKKRDMALATALLLQLIVWYFACWCPCHWHDILHPDLAPIRTTHAAWPKRLLRRGPDGERFSRPLFVLFKLVMEAASNLWNVDELVPVYTELQHRRQPSSYQSPREPQILLGSNGWLATHAQMSTVRQAHCLWDTRSSRQSRWLCSCVLWLRVVS